MTLQVRPFSQPDSPEVLALHHRALGPTGADAGVGPWDDDLSQIEETYTRAGGTFLVGTIEGRIVAMGALRRADASTAEIKRMRVHPEYQRRGYGQVVLSELERRALQLGVRRLYLDTGTTQFAAQRLYEKNGYSRFGEGEFHGIPLIYYEKWLAPPGRLTPVAGDVGPG